MGINLDYGSVGRVYENSDQRRRYDAQHFMETAGRLQKIEDSQWASWADMVPVITTIALGCFFSPTFTVGAAVGALSFCAAILSALVFRPVEVLKGEKKGGYTQEVLAHHPFLVAVAGPVIEELIFRGAIQGGINLLAQNLLPVTTIQLSVFPPMALANLVAVTATSILFGLVHATNDHPHVWHQVIACTAGGFIFGALMNQYGIAASIGCHSMNNCLVLSAYKYMHAAAMTAEKVFFGNRPG